MSTPKASEVFDDFYDEVDGDDHEYICPDCGVDLFQEEHEWDCMHFGDDDE